MNKAEKIFQEYFARIQAANLADKGLAAERRQALDWCQANGNPHKGESNEDFEKRESTRREHLSWYMQSL